MLGILWCISPSLALRLGESRSGVRARAPARGLARGDALRGLLRPSVIDRHDIALPMQGVFHGRGEGVLLPQITRAPVCRPALALGILKTRLVQALACIRLATAHNEFWL